MITLQRLQNWYAQNCNGDWEHENVLKIETTSNPGWLVEIDLAQTSIETVEFKISEEKSEQSWYFITVKNSKFYAVGDLSKLEFILSYFLDEFVPKFEDKDFEYEVLLPLEGINTKVWLTDSIAKKIDENTFQIVSIPNVIGNKFLTETFDDIKNYSQDFDKLKIVDKVGDLIQTTVITTFQGTRLAKKVKASSFFSNV